MIEEISAVVEFYMFRGRQTIQCVFNLLGYRAEWNSKVRGVFPEVAHQAPQRTLSVGKKNRGHLFYSARRTTFKFD